MTERCDGYERIILPKNILCGAGMLCYAKSVFFPVTSDYDEYGELAFLFPSSPLSSSSSYLQHFK